MKNLTLEHLLPYLPYKLMVTLPMLDKPHTMSGLGIDDDGTNKVYFHLTQETKWLFLEDIIPILRPISDLVNPILKEGLYKTPLKVLKSGGTDLDEFSKIKDWDGQIFYRCIDNEEHCLDYYVNDRCFKQSYRGDTRHYEKQAFSLNKLYKWHFDVFGLIDKGLAMDINNIR